LWIELARHEDASLFDELDDAQELIARSSRIRDTTLNMAIASFAVGLLAFQAPLPAPRQPQALSTTPQAAKAFGAAMLAALLTMAPVDEAFAAGRSGGRVGGRAPVSRAAPARAPVSRTTNVYVSPAPAVVYGGGYGYGGYGYGGGFGISPGAYLGLSLAETLIRENQRQAYLQQQLRTQQELGRDEAEIAMLQRALAEQNAKIEGLKSQQSGSDSGGDDVSRLKEQLRRQEDEIRSLQRN